jgi:hypothetical protein
MPPHTGHTEFSELFEAFFPAAIASRFSELLRMKPAHWKKIDPWQVWQHLESDSVTEWQDSVQSLLASPKFSRHAASQVAVLRCGHDRPSIERNSLHTALIGESALFEGFISVTPGKLGIAINHDGEICVLSR